MVVASSICTALADGIGQALLVEENIPALGPVRFPFLPQWTSNKMFD